MKKKDFALKIDPALLLAFIKEGVTLLIKGFDQIGFRKSTRKRLDELEKLVAAQGKWILEQSGVEITAEDIK